MKLRAIKGTNDAHSTVAFLCPGCGEEHQVLVNAKWYDNGPSWGFNGSFEQPTFHPSILIRSGHYAPLHKGESCWCTYNAEHPDSPAPFACVICHSFVKDGKIQFLGDCTHHLAGQTVELPEVDEQGLPINKTD